MVEPGSIKQKIPIDGTYECQGIKNRLLLHVMLNIVASC